MAKISARGAREAARWEAYKRCPAEDGLPAWEARYLVVLTTDGRVLLRPADGGSYTILATFKKNENSAQALTAAEVRNARVARVERFLAKRRFVDIERQAVRA